MTIFLSPFPQTCIGRGLPQCGFDASTGLLARNLFACKLERELTRVWPRASALLLIDLDGLDDLGEAFGRTGVEAVLEQFARRLENLAPRGAALGRLDRDTLALLLAGPDDLHQVTHTAAHIRRALDMPFDLAAGNIMLTACIGIATCPTDADTGAELLGHAGIALLHAGLAGHGVCCFYTASMQALPASPWSARHRAHWSAATTADAVDMSRPTATA